MEVVTVLGQRNEPITKGDSRDTSYPNTRIAIIDSVSPWCKMCETESSRY